MALYGSLASVRAQIASPEYFAVALAHVEECLRPGAAAYQRLAAVAVGQTDRVDLPGGAFSLLQAYHTKPRREGKWETHRAYIDVQALQAGEEMMEIADRSRLVVSEDLTPGRDVIFYHPFERGSALRFAVGDIGVYFPDDAHMGNLAIGSPGLVRKIVVKVPVRA